MIKRPAHTLLLTAAIILLNGALSACSTSRHAGSTQGAPAPTATESTWAAQVADIAASYGTWQRLRVPVKVELKSPKRVSISGHATMVRNSSIHISLRYIGIEVGWLNLTPDSIIVADKYHKRYMAEPLRPFLADAPLTITNVQDLLLGRMFEIGSPTALTPQQAAHGTADFDSLYYFLPRPPASTSLTCGFAFIPSASELSPFMMAAAAIGTESKPVEIAYGPAASTPAGPMSEAVTVSYQIPKTTIEATLNWNFDKSRWNADVTLPTPSVRGYSRVNLDQIMSMLHNL